MKVFGVLALLAAVLMVVPLQAGLIISTGNNPQPNEENILFNEVGLIGVGNPVTGMTNQSSLLVTFTSTETLVTPSGGQARFEAQDGGLMGFIVAMPGSTFEDYIFNLNTPVGVSGTATIKVNASSVLTGTFSIGSGSNFFTVLATSPDRITSVEVISSVPLTDVRQNRISGAAADIPEPGSVLLFSSGLIGLAILGARRRHRK